MQLLAKDINNVCNKQQLVALFITMAIIYMYIYTNLPLTPGNQLPSTSNMSIVYYTLYYTL